MIGEKIAVIGIYRDGVIIPEQDMHLPEGTRVEITLPADDLSEELDAESAAWDRAAADAWALIDEMEGKPVNRDIGRYSPPLTGQNRAEGVDNA